MNFFYKFSHTAPSVAVTRIFPSLLAIFLKYFFVSSSCLCVTQIFISCLHSDAPVCRPGLPQTYSVDRGEIANIKCEVESNPMAHDFRWKFNSSFADFTELQTSDDVKSILDFKPQSENDYMGTVLCWGINSIGMQTEPCVFQVVPAGKPEPLSNCTVVNQTQNSFQVVCVEGDDGGFPQDFVAELYYAREKYITNSISSR